MMIESIKSPARQTYMDCLRGLAMLMVVFCHTSGNFCLSIKEDNVVTRVAGICMLPTFFFVSGFFSPLILSLGGGN
ncbi:MAG: acyltransferase family protein [Bacteroidaceae bacterium]